LINESGSCAIIVLIVEDTCYVVNVGDSRAILSLNNGKTVQQLSQDHKPNREDEAVRIFFSGGCLYSRQSDQSVTQYWNMADLKNKNTEKTLRVFPGGLAITRSFGDARSKLNDLNGNPNAIICEPEINEFKITNKHDFIVIGSDGIFDKLSNEEISQIVWKCLTKDMNIHQWAAKSAE